MSVPGAATNAQPTGRRVAVVSIDPLPLPGLATSGAGLRAWQLGQGLRACGHDVTFVQPEGVLRQLAVPETPGVVGFHEPQLRERIAELAPDVVVFQHWFWVGQLGDLDVPVALDLHGPVLLENAHRDRAQLPALVQTKLRDLWRADFLSCAGVRQRPYFYAWMALAGYDMRADALAVIPVALDPAMPERNPGDEIMFVYGGIFLPWQNPALGLTTLAETLEARAQGRLKLFVGPHPVQSLPTAELDALMARLGASPRVERPGLVAHDQLIAAYLSASVAFDLMAPNPERELAFTTRTVEYLWCGLPVIYNNYAELAEYIEAYQAGWTVDPCDRAAIRRVVEQVLDAPEELARRGQNARRLISERLNWTAAIEPLDQFCRNPRRRAPRAAPLASDAGALLALLHERDGQLAQMTNEIERKNRHIAELESLLARIQNGRVMRLLRRLR
jgi:glycosyltransferase involved in cell wall biosynthesis